MSKRNICQQRLYYLVDTFNSKFSSNFFKENSFVKVDNRQDNKQSLRNH